MKQVYKTIDGQYFNDATDAQKWEDNVLECVKMWDWNKNPTTNTFQARLLHLIGENAGKMFKDMVAANEEEYNSISGDVIDDGDYGWFYWDEYAETYRYIDSEIVDLFIAANHQI